MPAYIVKRCVRFTLRGFSGRMPPSPLTSSVPEGHCYRGPMEILAGLVTKWLPTQVAKIDFQEKGGTLTATVDGFGQMKSQRLTNEAGQPTTMQNTGFTTALQFENQAARSWGTSL